MKSKWIKEFEDKIIDWDDHILLEKTNIYLIDLFIQQNFIHKKVKIKIGKRTILIERIK